VLITQSEYLFELDYYSGDLFAIDIQLEGIDAPATAPQVSLKATDLAYVLYTSGSTGKPKGVMIGHGSLSNYIRWANDYYFSGGHAQGGGPAEAPSFGLFTSLSFDLTLTSLFCSLSRGGRLKVYPQQQELSSILSDYLSLESGLDSIKLTPSHLNLLEGLSLKGTALKRAIVGGEALSARQVGILKAINPQIVVYNEYGPTEATVGCVVRQVEQTEPVLIGKPIANTQIYILAQGRHLQPVGVAGEICIGGAGLARGYLNREQLTAERFVTNPFDPQQKMYRTGDLGKWLEDGNIEYLGRIDEQVKVRGFRIELGEIEQALLAHRAIEQAVVIAKATDTEKELVAYFTTKGEAAGESASAHADLTALALRSFLGRSLPSYMVPAHFVQLPALPLTPNGKLDKKALPDPSTGGIASGVEYKAPVTGIERGLAAIWEEVLGRTGIGLEDNFFALGGHSLKATRLVSHIYKHFHVKLPLEDIFAQPLLREQALLLAQSPLTQFLSLAPAPEQESYPLSSAQKRLWVLSQLDQASLAYHMPATLRLEGPLEAAALEAAFRALIGRHESLRTVFSQDEQGLVRQVILPAEALDFRFDCHDLRHQPDQQEQLARLIGQLNGERFDLQQGPLLRAGLMQVEDQHYVLGFAMHHIVSDGWSMQILVKEVLACYAAFSQGLVPSLPSLRVHYKDYAHWQGQQLQGQAFQAHRRYWLEQLEGPLPVIELPTDKARPPVKTYNGRVLTLWLPEDLCQGLRAVVHQQQATLFMGLLSVTKALLYRYSGQPDLIIGTPVAGREHFDLEEQIGFFVNTLPLRTRLEAQDSFAELLTKVKTTSLEAYAHQLYPFDQLVEELPLQRDMSRSPLFDVLADINRDRAHLSQDQLGGLTVRAYEEGAHSVSKYDLTFMFVESDQGLGLNLEYNTDLFAPETILRMQGHFVGLLSAAVANPDLSIDQLDYLSASEKEQLLTDFNAPGVAILPAGTILDLLTAQALKTPQRVALVFEQDQLTYRQLDEQANQLAHYLIQHHQVGPNDLVGLLLDRSAHLVTAVLAILKAGAAFVPIEADYPPARKQFIIGQTGLKVLITQSEYLFELDYYSGDLFAIDIQLEGIDAPATAPQVSLKATDLAYVLYTSGSTGKPKGVMIGHGSLSNYIRWANDYYFSDEAQTGTVAQSGTVAETGSFGLFTSLSFDLTLTSLFCSLSRGGRLKVYPQQQELSSILSDYLSLESGLDSIKLTPSHLNLLEGLSLKGTALKRAIVGGEALSARQVGILKAINPQIAVYNEYGPTEATVGCVVRQVSQTEPVLIGKPIANTQIYILAQGRHLQPVGVAGEICIGGAGLARGYLNREELTAERFVTNPFDPQQKMYRTGDLGKWLEDGNIEYLGRIDEQVKVRGFRIELGEIEQALLAHRAIEQAVVIAKANGYRKGTGRLLHHQRRSSRRKCFRPC
jgi:amino acid adenylation domain-containing protein